MAATQPIRDKKQLQRLAEYYLKRGEFRNYALVISLAHTVLRVSDLVRLTWDDVYDAHIGDFRSHVPLIEGKTDKGKSIALNEHMLQALRLFYSHRRDKYIFANNRKDAGHITRQTAWRIIKKGLNAVGITEKVGCHGLRKTWGYHAWTSGKVSPVVIMTVYNHTNYAVTKRYLGITQDDIDQAYLGLTLFK